MSPFWSASNPNRRWRSTASFMASLRSTAVDQSKASDSEVRDWSGVGSRIIASPRSICLCIADPIRSRPDFQMLMLMLDLVMPDKPFAGPD